MCCGVISCLLVCGFDLHVLWHLWTGSRSVCVWGRVVMTMVFGRFYTVLSNLAFSMSYYIVSDILVLHWSCFFAFSSARWCLGAQCWGLVAYSGLMHCFWYATFYHWSWQAHRNFVLSLCKSCQNGMLPALLQCVVRAWSFLLSSVPFIVLRVIFSGGWCFCMYWGCPCW